MRRKNAAHYKMDKKDKRKDALITLLAVGMGVCICVLLMSWGIYLKPSNEPEVGLVPDRAPEQVEVNQTALDQDSSSNDGVTAEQTDTSTEYNRVSLSYTKEVYVSLSSKIVSLYFGSGSRSKVDIVLQIVVQDQVLAQSGRLTPGNKIETLDLVEGAVSRLSKGSYDGYFMLFYYDSVTGEKSTVTTTTPITVEVLG